VSKKKTPQYVVCWDQIEQTQTGWDFEAIKKIDTDVRALTVRKKGGTFSIE
jgi:hypothetical protein